MRAAPGAQHSVRRWTSALHRAGAQLRPARVSPVDAQRNAQSLCDRTDRTKFALKRRKVCGGLHGIWGESWVRRRVALVLGTSRCSDTEGGTRPLLFFFSSTSSSPSCSFFCVLLKVCVCSSTFSVLCALLVLYVFYMPLVLTQIVCRICYIHVLA